MKKIGINRALIKDYKGKIPSSPHYCAQCSRDMGNEWLLGPVCGKCCRANHKRVTSK